MPAAAPQVLATHHTDMLSLIRSILVQQISDPASAAAGVLLSLPNMDSEKLEAFKAALFGTGSEKVQREAIKKLLVSGSSFGGTVFCQQEAAGKCSLKSSCF